MHLYSDYYALNTIGDDEAVDSGDDDGDYEVDGK